MSEAAWEEGTHRWVEGAHKPWEVMTHLLVGSPSKGEENPPEGLILKDLRTTGSDKAKLQRNSEG